MASSMSRREPSPASASSFCSLWSSLAAAGGAFAGLAGTVSEEVRRSAGSVCGRLLAPPRPPRRRLRRRFFSPGALAGAAPDSAACGAGASAADPPSGLVAPAGGRNVVFVRLHQPNPSLFDLLQRGSCFRDTSPRSSRTPAWCRTGRASRRIAVPHGVDPPRSSSVLMICGDTATPRISPRCRHGDRLTVGDDRGVSSTAREYFSGCGPGSVARGRCEFGPAGGIATGRQRDQFHAAPGPVGAQLLEQGPDGVRADPSSKSLRNSESNGAAAVSNAASRNAPWLPEAFTKAGTLAWSGGAPAVSKKKPG